MLPVGCRVLCAVSGGADSMCLLHLLWERRERLGIRVAAAHFEHGIRGGDSLADAAFVEEFCRRRGIPCTVEHGNVPEYAKEHGMGIEEAARELRYAFLERTADALGCDRIATAHNADDNAETVLFNLCRGAGADGLCGIPPVRGRIVRPLLGVTRREIEEYLAQNGVPHREDATNASDEYSRNLLRHRVMPVLREINPRVSESVLRTSETLRENGRHLQNEADAFIARFFDGGSVPQRELAALDRAVAAAVVRTLCPRSLSRGHVDAALALCEGTELAFADLPGIRLRRERGRIFFGAQEREKLVPRELVPGEVLRVPEAGVVFRSEITEQPPEIYGLFKTYIFKYDSICGRIFITPRMDGDKLRPAGRGCTKSLKSLFAEAGYDSARRDGTAVIRDEKGILAVCGLCADERTMPAPGDRVLVITMENEKEEN